MARLSYKQRKRLPKASFVYPSMDGYPIDTPGRARAALSRVSQFGTPAQKRRVVRAVRKKYPGMKLSEDSRLAKSLRRGRRKKAK